MPESRKPERKIAKPRRGLSDIERIIAMYITYAIQPVPIDNIISLSGLPTITALNLMEDLKKCHFVCEKKETGKGFYYPGDIDIQDYILKNIPKNELYAILKRVISFITEFHRDGEVKIIALAELYFQIGIDAGGMEYIKKAADILYDSGKKEKANIYYYSIIKYFQKECIASKMMESQIEYYLDSVYRRISIGVFHPIPIAEQLEILEKAHEVAKHYKNPIHLARIKIFLGFTLKHLGQTRKASHHINEFWKLAENISNKDLINKAFFFASITIAMHGNFSEAINCYEKMIGNMETFHNDEEALLANLLIAYCHVSSGRLSRGMGMIVEVRKKAQILKLDKVVNEADIINAFSLIQMRKIAEAEKYIEKLLSLKTNSLSPGQISNLYCCKAYILSNREEYKEAFQVIKKAFILRESIGMGPQGPYPTSPWILECLYLLESSGFIDEDVNLDIEIRKAFNNENLFIKGAACRYRALRNMDRQQSRRTILPDLKLSEKLLKQSGAEIELARTRIIIKNYYLALGKQKLARSSIDKSRAFLLNIDESVIPNDLMEEMPWERKTEFIIDKITSINRSLGTLKDKPSLLDMVMNVAMDFTNAMQSCIFILNGEDLQLIASRNIDPYGFNSSNLKPFQKVIVNAIRKGKEIVLPNGDQDLIKNFSAFGFRSFIGIPLRLDGSDYGCFALSNHFGNVPFSVETLYFARMFASQIEVASSIFNTYEKIKNGKERLKDETIFYRREMGLDLPIEQIIGKSNGIKKTIEQIRQVASADSLALILGETGVGKELVAKAIHNLSDRKDGPFIPVNLSAFPQDLVASELFGHEKGAFTGANEKKKGRFELADGGTIFLDEIGELAPNVQVKLLRVFEEGTFQRLGSSIPICSNFRVIAATNKNLRYEVEKGRFRRDLYYRLNVFPIHVPPLRERKNDIGILAQHFLSMYNKKLDRNIDKIPAEELNKLISYHWPGNVRELKHFIERAVILSNGNDISFSGLELEAENQSPDETNAFATLDDVEREQIKKTLKRTLWKISGPSGAASFLGLNPSTLRHRMRKLGIKKPSITQN